MEGSLSAFIGEAPTPWIEEWCPLASEKKEENLKEKESQGQ